MIYFNHLYLYKREFFCYTPIIHRRRSAMKLLPHNEKAVNEIMKDFKNGKQCVIYTSGVGTGKSFVFLGVLERLRKMGMKGKLSMLFRSTRYVTISSFMTIFPTTETALSLPLTTHSRTTRTACARSAAPTSSLSTNVTM